MTNTKSEVSIEDIACLLISDDKEKREAVGLIDSRYRNKLFYTIQLVALSANSDDILEIYQEVLLDIYKASCKEGFYHEPNSLFRFIITVCKNKAKNWLRKKHAQKRDCSKEELIDSINTDFTASKQFESWQDASGKENRLLIINAIRNKSTKMKLRQRQIIEILIDNYPYALSDKEYQQEIKNRYGENPTIDAVKKARQQVYQKLRDILGSIL